MSSNMVLISVKWNGQKYDNISVDTNESVEVLKSQIFSLTGVEPHRQKLLNKGIMLKDDSRLSNFGWKDGQVIMMMGSVEGPAERSLQNEPSISDDKKDNDHTKDPILIPCGLKNLGNTCYLNATLQCMIGMTGLKDRLIQFSKDNEALAKQSSSTLSPDVKKKLIFCVGDLFKMMDDQSICNPLPLLMLFRTIYPQFAEIAPGSIWYAQQDAEECYSEIMSAIKHSIHEEALDQFLLGKFKTETKCLESSDETILSGEEAFSKLNCHISNNTFHLMAGLGEGLKTEVQMHSNILNRTANFEKTFKISTLPFYLTVHFIRFFWKREQNVKAKILKKVGYPSLLDLYSLCSPEYQEQLKPARDRLAKVEKEGKNIDTSSIMGKNITGFYELVAVLTHVGRTADGGHYMAWVRDKTHEKLWWKFDDQTVTQVQEEDILRLDGGGDWHMAYMCFYKAKTA